MGDIRFVDGLVGKLEFDIPIRIAPKIIADFDRITAVIAEQFQIVAINAAELHLVCFDAVETEGLFPFVVRHLVRTVPLGKDVGVVSRTAVELVVSCAAD